MDKDLAGQVVDIAQRVVAGGAISANGHGNVSVRVAGAEEMYFTAGPSLRGHPASTSWPVPASAATSSPAATTTPCSWTGTGALALFALLRQL